MNYKEELEDLGFKENEHHSEVDLYLMIRNNLYIEFYKGDIYIGIENEQSLLFPYNIEKVKALIKLLS